MNRTKNHVRYAPVAPLPLLKEMWSRDMKDEDTDFLPVHGGYHLLLAHDVLKDPVSQKQYYEHFERVRDHHQDNTLIIMDNSIVELGDAVPLKTVASAAVFATADVMVLPDVMGDGSGTINKYLSLRSEMDQIHQNLEFMAVPQGPTMSDFAACLETFVMDPRITWIGIPRIATGQLGSRRWLIDLATAINPDWSLHLLGFSDNVIDDVLCATHSSKIEGIDSAVPVRAGQQGQPFRLSQSDYGKRGSYWDNPGPLNELTVANVRRVRKYIGER